MWEEPGLYPSVGDAGPESTEPPPMGLWICEADSLGRTSDWGGGEWDIACMLAWVRGVVDVADGLEVMDMWCCWERGGLAATGGWGGGG